MFWNIYLIVLSQSFWLIILVIEACINKFKSFLLNIKRHLFYNFSDNVIKNVYVRHLVFFRILLICFTSFNILESDLWRQSEKYVNLLYLEGFLLSSDFFLYEFLNLKIKLIEFIFRILHFEAWGYNVKCGAT